MNKEFSGNVVIVIGATGGIGAATGTLFAERGATVIMASRSGDTDLADGLQKKGLQAESRRVDARREQDVNNMVRHVLKRFGRIDILVNSQAVNQCRLLENIALRDWNNVLATNITSMFLTCKACLPHMKKRRAGKIINISSVAARNRSPVSGVHYVASKAAVLGFTRQLAFEVAPFGINVNAICPGQTMTPMLLESMTPLQRRRLADSIPLRRIAEPEEQAAVIAFLASDAARYMSGAIVDVNGGQI